MKIYTTKCGNCKKIIHLQKVEEHNYCSNACKRRDQERREELNEYRNLIDNLVDYLIENKQIEMKRAKGLIDGSMILFLNKNKIKIK